MTLNEFKLKLAKEHAGQFYRMTPDEFKEQLAKKHTGQFNLSQFGVHPAQDAQVRRARDLGLPSRGNLRRRLLGRQPRSGNVGAGPQ